MILLLHISISAVFPSHLIEGLPAKTNHAVKAQHQVRFGGLSMKHRKTRRKRMMHGASRPQELEEGDNMNVLYS